MLNDGWGVGLDFCVKCTDLFFLPVPEYHFAKYAVAALLSSYSGHVFP
jgi:hypothetical protein